jgi:GNAT superfamily N-acetyltransferase
MPATRSTKPQLANSQLANSQLTVEPRPAVERGTRASQECMASTDTLLIRPISPDDKQQLVEGFQRLGERSRYRRFLSPHEHLSEAELRYFTEVDHHDHEALIAIDSDSREGVGVARYVRSKIEPSTAELAVAVVDDWQGRGVGGRLAAALADRARAEGITSFTALVLADNQLMLNLLRDLGRVRVIHSELGTVELTVDLPETGLGHLPRLLGAVARGDVRARGHAPVESVDGAFESRTEPLARDGMRRLPG